VVSSLQDMLPKLVRTFFVYHVLIISVLLVWSLFCYTNIINLLAKDFFFKF
jgi:hypothetical protein